jgi:hypothetical protein
VHGAGHPQPQLLAPRIDRPPCHLTIESYHARRAPHALHRIEAPTSACAWLSLLPGAAADSNPESKKVLTQSASGLAVELPPKRKGTRPSKAAPIVPRASLTVPADAPQPSLARPQSAPILRAPPTSLQSASVGGRSARPNSAHVHKRKPPSRRPTAAWGPGPPTPLVRWAMRAPPPLPPPPPPPPSLPKGRLADLAWTIMRPGDAAGASRARDAPDLTSEARQPPSPASPLPPTPPLHPSSPALPCPALPCPLLFPCHLLCPLRDVALARPGIYHLGLISASSRPHLGLISASSGEPPTRGG